MNGAPSAKTLGWELALVTFVLTALASLLFALRDIAWIGSALSALVAVLFLYGPIVVLSWRHRAIDFIGRDVHAYLRSGLVFLVVALIIFPPFFGAAFLWQKWVFGAGEFHAAGFENFGHMFLFQLIMVALPEEFYFRGYFQSTIDKILPKRWPIFGVHLGWGWIITAAVFALAHSIVVVKWWHFSIFFPALVFGYLRERTGSITAPILFHAASNLFMNWFASCFS